MFGTTNPLFDNNGTKPHLPLHVRPRAVCTRCARLRAIWEGGISPPQIGCIPLYPPLRMAEPWMSQYGVYCLLPFVPFFR